jgi:hypothetical protein
VSVNKTNGKREVAVHCIPLINNCFIYSITWTGVTLFCQNSDDHIGK